MCCLWEVQVSLLVSVAAFHDLGSNENEKRLQILARSPFVSPSIVDNSSQ
jgi:hypothetical protein